MPPSGQQSPNQNSGLWISREEYERLRQAEAQQAYQPVLGVPQPPVIYSANSQPPQSTHSSLQIVTGVVLAVVFLLCMTVSAFRPLSWIGGFALIVFAVVSYVDFARARRAVVQTQKSADYSTSKSVYKTLLTIAGILLLIPLIIVGGYIALIIIILATSGGRGS